MFLGKLSPAMKYISSEDETLGVHILDEKIKNILLEKHPKGREASEDILLPDNAADPLLYQ